MSDTSSEPRRKKVRYAVEEGPESVILINCPLRTADDNQYRIETSPRPRR